MSYLYFKKARRGLDASVVNIRDAFKYEMCCQVKDAFKFFCVSEGRPMDGEYRA